jgi:hypothetical protein
VIAKRRGSVPEIIDDGVSGFVVDSEDEALAAIARVSELDRRRVRAAFEQRFTAHRMAKEYVRLYEELVAQAVAPPSQNGARLGAARADVPGTNSAVAAISAPKDLLG